MKQCNIKEASYDAMFTSPWASHYDVEDEHRCEIFGFCLLSFCQNERFHSFLNLYIFEANVFIFQFLNDKMYNYVKHNITVNFIIQKLKNKHTFLKKYTN